jgi:aspartate racemase
MSAGKKILGVLGGMGPQATIDFQQKVLDLTLANHDHEHLRVFVDSHPQIPKRPAAILASGESPVAAMQQSLDKLMLAGAEIIAMPCVTAHYFLPQLNVPLGIQFLKMPDLIAAACRERFLGKTAGVLSTSATAQSGTVTSVLEKAGIPYITPNDACKQILDTLIIEVKSKQDMDKITERFCIIVDNMKSQGADYFVLACTEIPLIVQSYNFPHPFVDATTELAIAAIKASGYELAL